MISGQVGTWRLEFTALGITKATTNPVTVTTTPRAATQLWITTQPSASTANGAVFAQQPVVQLRDASLNSVSQAGVAVTASIASGARALGGTLTVITDESGVATFTDLMITGIVGVRALSLTAQGLTGVTSNTITITAGAATQLAITTQPVGGASGALLATQPVVEIQDAQGNRVTSDNRTSVTVAIQSGAGGTLGGTLTVTASAGVVTYTNPTLAGTVGVNYVLRFSAMGRPAPNSGTTYCVSPTAGTAYPDGLHNGLH